MLRLRTLTRQRPTALQLPLRLPPELGAWSSRRPSRRIGHRTRAAALRSSARLLIGVWFLLLLNAALPPLAPSAAAAGPDAVLAADGFDYPIARPDGRGYHIAGDFLEFFDETYHPGEDWNRGTGDADLGDPVYAIASGRVVASGYYKCWGNVVLVEHRAPPGQKFILPDERLVDVVWSQYAHLDKRSVTSGEVGKGAQIGTIGKGDPVRRLVKKEDVAGKEAGKGESGSSGAAKQDAAGGDAGKKDAGEADTQNGGQAKADAAKDDARKGEAGKEDGEDEYVEQVECDYWAHLHLEIRYRYRPADAWVTDASPDDVKQSYVKPSDFIALNRRVGDGTRCTGGTPQLAGPDSQRAGASQSLTFSWSPVPGCSRYRFEAWNDAVLGIEYRADVEGTSHAVALDRGGPWRWQVRVIRNDGSYGLAAEPLGVTIGFFPPPAAHTAPVSSPSQSPPPPGSALSASRFGGQHMGWAAAGSSVGLLSGLDGLLTSICRCGGGERGPDGRVVKLVGRLASRMTGASG